MGLYAAMSDGARCAFPVKAHHSPALAPTGRTGSRCTPLTPGAGEPAASRLTDYPLLGQLHDGLTHRMARAVHGERDALVDRYGHRTARRDVTRYRAPDRPLHMLE